MFHFFAISFCFQTRRYKIYTFFVFHIRGLKRFLKAFATDSTFFLDLCVYAGRRWQCSFPLSPFSNCPISRVLARNWLRWCIVRAHRLKVSRLFLIPDIPTPIPQTLDWAYFIKVSSNVLSTAQILQAINDLATLKTSLFCISSAPG